MNIIQSPSQNYSKSTYAKIGVQIHKTLGKMPGTLTWMRNPKSNASCHYLITRQGLVHQLVDIKNRSWSSGRINNPSKRALGIMLKNFLGIYVKPGHYLIQIEFECLGTETYTDKQYQSAVELFKQFDIVISPWNLLTHQDTAIDKPSLEVERTEIIKRLYKKEEKEEKKQIQIQIQTKEDIKREIIRLINKL